MNAAAASVEGGLAFRESSTRCSWCREEVVWVTPGIAAFAMQTSELTVMHLAERGKLHSRITADGAIVLCLESLFEVRITREAELM